MRFLATECFQTSQQQAESLSFAQQECHVDHSDAVFSLVFRCFTDNVLPNGSLDRKNGAYGGQPLMISSTVPLRSCVSPRIDIQLQGFLSNTQLRARTWGANCKMCDRRLLGQLETPVESDSEIL